MIWALLRPFLPYLICTAIAGGAYLWADFGWCNGACRDARDDLATEQGKVKSLEDYASAQEALAIRQRERWLQQTSAEELRAKQVEAQRARAFTGMAANARIDPASRAVPLTDSGKRMLGDAYQAAVAAEAAAVPAATPAADTAPATLADQTAWGIDMLAWAAMCRDRVDSWVRWYSSLATPVGTASPAIAADTRP